MIHDIRYSLLYIYCNLTHIQIKFVQIHLLRDNVLYLFSKGINRAGNSYLISLILSYQEISNTTKPIEDFGKFILYIIIFIK